MADGYVWFEGIAFPVPDFKPEVLREVRDKFVVKDEDVITVTYPKSGTNWLMEIVCLIHSKGDPKWVQSVPNWQRAPWVETAHGYEILQNSEGPRIFTSHLPIQLFPKSFFHSKAKVIYGMRNPRDVFVSSYFFMQKLNVAKKPETQQQYLEWFLQGNVVYGSWFEHIRGWLSRRQCENFLVVSYEELTKDTRSVVEKICQFLGKELKPEEIDLVLKYSSFEFMKENKMSNFSTLPDMFLNEGFSLQRKGVTGDWKNHFTVAQAEVFDEVYQQNMAGFPPKLFPWE
ncbi:3-beta-hydroxysteroid sulfotransferase [Fukomys damarensis]|uniref:Sulfotransferase n=1 Tax=Fukomys damarensis TaxID=885580 RepID=A0A091DU06_FUKDA|nr:3-beta-hydroxysteroid sulfotransferase [Fukomys damarensis]KFO26261.1 3-beta-hydroxysteroid sulfotransferase [Fukomys damarensis]